MSYSIIRVSESPNIIPRLSLWLSERWGISDAEYAESMNEAVSSSRAFPEWYAALLGERIVGAVGVIENDFHPRRDLTPNLCALFVEPDHRGRGLAGELISRVLEGLMADGVKAVYLVTDHVGFYERYGWEYLCPVTTYGEQQPSRVYRYLLGGEGDK